MGQPATDRKNSRISVTSSGGAWREAKWPPTGYSFQRTTVLAASARPRTARSPRKFATPVGTPEGSGLLPHDAHPGPAVDADQLTAISAAIRAAETLRFDYRGHTGDDSRRSVEPHRIAHWGHRWYLVGWDCDRADWRTFRVDRMSLRTPNGPRFTHRPSPDSDVVAYLRRTMGFAMWPYRSVMRVHVPAEQLASRIEGLVTPIDEYTCRLEMGADSYALVALVVGMLDVEFEVESPPELLEHLRALAERFTRAAGWKR